MWGSAVCRYQQAGPSEGSRGVRAIYKHLPWLSAQTECFRSVKRGRRERSPVGFLLCVGGPEELGESWDAVHLPQRCLQPAGSVHTCGVWKAEIPPHSSTG